MRQFEYGGFVFFYELFAVDMPSLTNLPRYTPRERNKNPPRLPPFQGCCPHSAVCHGRAGVEPLLTTLMNCGLTTNSPNTLGVSVLGAAQNAPFLGA